MPTFRTKLQIVYVAVFLFFCLATRLALAETELAIYSASASSYNGSHPPSKTIDKKLSTYWRGSFLKSPWQLRLDLGKQCSLSRISIFWNKSQGSGKYHIQASNDGKRWVNFYTNLSSKGGRVNPYRKNYNLIGTYRYVRLYINRAQFLYPIIYEVKLYGSFPPDTTAPTGSIKINNNAQYTNSTAVTLNLSAKDNSGGIGLSQMRFSNDNSTWSSPQAYAATRRWTLPSGDGSKTVYARYKDKAGNWSGIYSDTIILDKTAPSGSIKINNNAASTNTTSVTLNLSARDTKSGVSEMKFSNNNSTWSSPEAYAVTRSWTLLSGDGNKTVYVKFKDAAGNWSGIFSDTITLDTIVTANISYSYDDLNRLENMAVNGMSATYTYDEVGNIENETTQNSAH